MKIIKSILPLLLFIFHFASPAYGATFNECTKLSASLNKDLPKEVDSITTALSTKCEGSDPVYLVYSMQVAAAVSKLSATQLQTLREDQIDFWCSSKSQYRLLKLVGIKYKYFNSVERYLGQTSFTANNCAPSDIASLDMKFDSKNHPKAKGMWVTVRYPKGWKAKEGERPNIVQKFTGDYKGLFVMLSLQIMDAGTPIEKECADTPAREFGRDIVDGEEDLKVLTIRKIQHERKPAYLYDLQYDIDRAGKAWSAVSRVMSICHKNTLISAWCNPMELNTKNAVVRSDQNDLETVDNLCFQFFNSLVLMDSY